MSWLARLKNHKAPDAHATKPTKPPEQAGGVGFVGFVAHSPTPFQKIEASEAAANDATTTPAADPDRWCWPHSEAMNGQELDTFTARLARFTEKGLTLAQAEAAADRLVIRDREGDDRALCLGAATCKATGDGGVATGNWRTWRANSLPLSW
jgi:hypothetical protein